MRTDLNLTLWLIRHGETDRNCSTLIGQSKDEPLNARGKEQARLLGERLRKDVEFDHVYVSSMVRAQQTFEEAKPKVKGTVLTDVHDLREIDQGAFQGKERRDLVDDAELWARYKRNGMGFAFPGGESQYDVAHRARSFVDVEVLNNTNTRTDKQLNVLILSHGMTTKALLWSFLGWEQTMTGRAMIDNCSISKVNIRAGAVFLHSINDTGHLL